MNEIAKDLTKLATAIAENISRFQTVSSNVAGFTLRRRIFNDGKATEGSGIGEYNNLPYRKYRERRGRQVSYVDLELSGDLRRSITTGVAGKDVVLGFVNEDEVTIAESHQKRYGKEIFVLNDAELEAAEEAFIREVDIVAREAF